MALIEARDLHTAQDVRENYKRVRSYWRATYDPPRPVSIAPIEAAPAPLIIKSGRDWLLPITARRVQQVICKHYRISHKDLLSHRRPAGLVFPRQIAMYLTKQLTHNSLPEIGRRFGNRDHTTVLHALRKIKRLREADPDLDATINALHAHLISAPAA